jgi:hypothetical protein
MRALQIRSASTHGRPTRDTPTHVRPTRDMPTHVRPTRDTPIPVIWILGILTRDRSARRMLTHAWPIPGSPIRDSMTRDSLPTPDTPTCVPERSRRAIHGPRPDLAQRSGDRRSSRRERSRIAA